MERRLKLSFPILHDAGNRTATAWSLAFVFSPELQAIYKGFGIDLPGHNGASAGWTLPMPARFVIDGDGALRQSEIHPDYTKRPEPATTLAVVDQLTG